jgi:ubiquinone/menaquinone biosynthesis C-methylase UbiE
MKNSSKFEYSGRKKAEDYYDEFSATYEKERHHSYHKMIDDMEIAGIMPYLKKEMKVLDAGCGTGIIMQQIREFIPDITGIDISHGMLEIAKRRNLDVQAADLASLPFKDGTFDFVYSFKVLPHIQKIENAIKELSRVTKKSGFLVLEFYNSRSIRGLIKKFKPPSSISGSVQDTDMFTRIETLNTFISYLPSELKIVEICGIRTITPSAFFIRIPVLGLILKKLEKILSGKIIGRKFGGFVVVICRKV